MHDLLWLLPYLRRYRLRLLIGALSVLAANLTWAFTPRIVGHTVDGIIARSLPTTFLLLNLGGILGLTLLGGALTFLMRQTIIVVSRILEYELRNDFLHALERHSARFFHTYPTGELMAYATNDISSVREFLGPAIMYGLNTAMALAFSLLFMLTLDVPMTVFALLPLPLAAVLTYTIGRRVHATFTTVQEQFGELTRHAQESFAAIRVVRAYGAEAAESDRFRRLSWEYALRNIRLGRLQAFSSPSMLALVGIVQLIVLGYGGFRLMEQTLTAGELTQFFLYTNELIWPFAALGWITNIVQRAAASAARLRQLMELTPDVPDTGQLRIRVQELHGRIEFRNVWFRYSDDRPWVLRGVSFTIPAGSIVGITGPIGSGKSTLVTILTRLYDVTQGCILLDGHDIRDYPLHVLRSAITVVPQEPFLFSLSVAENIRFGKPDASLEEVLRASQWAALHSDVELFPKGYDTLVGERGITLSGGQKQRVALARALLRSSPVLVLDDAFSSIDSATESAIQRRLRELTAGRTIILIAHRIASLLIADRILVLDNGIVAEEGTHSELLQRGGLYAQLNQYQTLQAELEQL
ncbi:MAG: ABC transporter ATP-binding protein/permease [Candidatus Kapabacteria bacterium]|nr:ABC transporter ATP-binding protein/permease [Candidatus Kapabacteria bacterium]